MILRIPNRIGQALLSTHLRPGCCRLVAGTGGECHPQKMKRGILSGAILALLLASSVFSAAQEKGYWRAASSNANEITGDLTVSDAKITINLIGFPLAQIRKLTPAEMGAAFDADVNAPGTGNLYRLHVPADRRFLHRNTLCGAEDTQWMATYVAGHRMEVVLFSGPDTPVLTGEALANSSDVCGRFTYER